ncbi:MAG: type III pantothenate kinase [Deferribacteres bacterium]|nr:type III pantothenate kinase [Deferribacteres bacterium]
MLLAVDIGNTNIVIGVYRGKELVNFWRVGTDRKKTIFEYAVVISGLFSLNGLPAGSVKDAVISSVVPPLTGVIKETLSFLFDIEPLIVGPGVKTGMPVLVDNPKEVGTDRIVNAVGAYSKYGGPLVVVDFGTATTFDAVSAKGEYLGGAICPGIGISLEALFRETAQLPKVDFKKPRRVIGKNTIESMQSGIFYGYVSLVDGMVERMKKELSGAKCVATGGYASAIAHESSTIEVVDPWITLEGLRIIYEKNRSSLL